MGRPYPPERLRRPGSLFEPAPDLARWIRLTFLDGASALFNEDHAHLEFARIGCLWTNAITRRGGRVTVGTCEMPRFDGGGWRRARQEAQFTEWFGDDWPDFVLTFLAPYTIEQSDTVWCAIVEHELYHAGQARGQWGEPLFSRATGRPKFAMRGHDVEEFAGVVRRYGVGAATEGVRDLVDAAAGEPEIRAVWTERACGTCYMLGA